MNTSATREHRHEIRNSPRNQQLQAATRLHDGIQSPRIRNLLEQRIHELKAEVAVLGR